MLETDVDASSADIVSWYPPAQPLPLPLRRCSPPPSAS